MRIPFIWDTRRDKVAFIGLVVVPLLLAMIGCTAKVEDRKHVVCYDDVVSVCTYRGIAKGNVFIIHKNDTHYLTFIDEQGEQVILDLANKQCGVN